MPFRKISEDDQWITNDDGDVTGIRIHGRSEELSLENLVSGTVDPVTGGVNFSSSIALPVMNESLAGTMVTFGDSFAQLPWGFQSPSNTTYGTTTRGVCHWLNYFLGAPWKMIQPYGIAVSGSNTAEWIAQHALLMSMNPRPDWVWLAFPTNDVNQGVAAETSISRLETIVTDNLKRGSKVILDIGGLHYNYTPQRRGEARKINNWLRATAAKYNLYIVDGVNCIGNLTTGLFADPYSVEGASAGVHRSISGCLKIVQDNIDQFIPAARRAYAGRFLQFAWNTGCYNPMLDGGTTAPTGWSNYGPAGTRSKSNRTDLPAHQVLNLSFTAASEGEESGIQQAGISLALSRENSASVSLGARVLVDGEHYVCTAAGTTAATKPTFDTTIGATTSDGTAVWTRILTIVPGVTKLRYLSEVEIVSGNAFPRQYVNFVGSATDVTTIKSGIPIPPDSIPAMPARLSGIMPVAVTPDFVVPPGVTSLTCIATVRGKNGSAIVANFGRQWLEVVE